MRVWTSFTSIRHSTAKRTTTFQQPGSTKLPRYRQNCAIGYCPLFPCFPVSPFPLCFPLCFHCFHNVLLRSPAGRDWRDDDDDYSGDGDYACEAILRLKQKWQGRGTEPPTLPETCAHKHCVIPRRQIRRAKSFGMNWNETAFWKFCKLLKTWWPGTESNRRRQPFQGLLRPRLSA